MCSARRGEATAEFYQIGQGGLPDSPDAMSTDELERTWTPWVKPSPQNTVRTSTQTQDNSFNRVGVQDTTTTTMVNLPCHQ